MKSLKLYIASSFEEAKNCETVRRNLKRDGHIVPDVWWNVKTKDDFEGLADFEFYGAPLVQSIALRHWATLQECDAVILVSNATTERKFTGANVEVGYALALGKPVFSIGKIKRSAMYAPIVKCDTSDELRNVVNCLAQNGR